VVARVVSLSLFSKYFEASAANGAGRQPLTTGSLRRYKHSRSWGRSSVLTTVNAHRETSMKQFHGTTTVPDNPHIILLIEDELKLLEVLGRFLSRHGYTVFQAPDADIAMDVYEREKIDVVLLDIKLPRTSGYDLFTKMRIMNPAVKVVISSGCVDADLEAQLLNAGIRRALHKPYSLEELIKVLQETIDS
jgi:CheY-like chemotaxis protein